MNSTKDRNIKEFKVRLDEIDRIATEPFDRIPETTHEEYLISLLDIIHEIASGNVNIQYE